MLSDPEATARRREYLTVVAIAALIALVAAGAIAAIAGTMDGDPLLYMPVVVAGLIAASLLASALPIVLEMFIRGVAALVTEVMLFFKKK